MNCTAFSPEFSTIMPRLIAGGLVLLIFGVAYNFAIDHLIRKSYLDAYTAIAVVGGVLVTLLVVLVALWNVTMTAQEYTLVAIGAFACSGTPMIVGSMARYWEALSAELDALRKMNV